MRAEPVGRGTRRTSSRPRDPRSQGWQGTLLIRLLVARAGAAVTLVSVAAVVVALGAAPAVAASSTRAAAAPRGRVHGASSSQLQLAKAPAGLRAAVRRTFGSALDASSGLQQAELTASDGHAGDGLGWSVALSGTTAVVGADSKNDFTGAAYVFVKSGKTWIQQAELAGSDTASGDDFGDSVAVSGTTAVVGAPHHNDSTGAAYVFVRSKGAWIQQAELTASDAAAGDDFGWSVAVSGNDALVGAPTKNAGAGMAYWFLRSGTTWTQEPELAQAYPGSNLGSSVAIAGPFVAFPTIAVVGAMGLNDGTGVAWIFALVPGEPWQDELSGDLTASDGAPGDKLGAAVAISPPADYGTTGSNIGSTILVGAPLHNGGVGAAYAFTFDGEFWPQTAEITAPGGATGTGFGASVAVAGSTALVGAEDVNSFHGEAYSFEESGTRWSPGAYLTAADATEFGSSVALSGTTALVGADGNNGGTGAAYVESLPAQQAELTAADGAANDYLGYSVALSGTTAVVGAPGRVIFSRTGNSDPGAAYVFVRSGKTWSEQAELTAADGAAADNFGISVALSGTTAVVGAPAHDGGTGAAYVFVRSGTTWSQQAELTAADGAGVGDFGWSVALSGITTVVGAPGNNGGTGAAYVFVRSGTAWSQQAELTAADGAAGDDFGVSVALSGATAVVGAPGHNNAAGAAYVFVRSRGIWYQVAPELTAADGAVGDDFGSSVALSGTTALVGALGNNSDTGAAYVFVLSGTTWSEQAELTAADGAAGDNFGSSVALAGTTALVGAGEGNNAGTGAAYVFAWSGAVWSEQAELTAADGAADDGLGFSVAASGSTALVGAYGNKANTGAAYVFTPA